MFLEDIGAELISLGICCIPFFLIYRVERKRPINTCGTVAAIVIIVLAFFRNSKDIPTAFSISIILGPIVYYIVERMTRKGD